jgi:hypothetical protein
MCETTTRMHISRGLRRVLVSNRSRVLETMDMSSKTRSCKCLALVRIETPRGPIHPAGVRPPCGVKVSLGTETPRGPIHPAGVKPPCGARAPFGTETPRGPIHPAGVEPPCGARVPFGTETPRGPMHPAGVAGRSDLCLQLESMLPAE